MRTVGSALAAADVVPGGAEEAGALVHANGVAARKGGEEIRAHFDPWIEAGDDGGVDGHFPPDRAALGIARDMHIFVADDGRNVASRVGVKHHVCKGDHAIGPGERENGNGRELVEVALEARVEAQEKRDDGGDGKDSPCQQNGVAREVEVVDGPTAKRNGRHHQERCERKRRAPAPRLEIERSPRNSVERYGGERNNETQRKRQPVERRRKKKGPKPDSKRDRVAHRDGALEASLAEAGDEHMRIHGRHLRGRMGKNG